MSLELPVKVSCADVRCDGVGDLTREVWYCSTCASCLCEKCWGLSPIHAASGATKHQKLSYRQYVRCSRLNRILSPSTDPSGVEKLHQQDTNTTWFGIDRYEDGRPFLQDFEIYSHIMANLPEPEQLKYPSLVSFVGQTGAGKSTVVKMLIDQAESRSDLEADPTFPSPVAGNPANDSTPTSADVHLYCDPATFSKERPILYADCEGLNAGERRPMGAHSKRDVRLDNSTSLGLRVRPLEWATSDEKRTRQYAVTSIYPRLLYTFSDVVVFVLKEPKTFAANVLPKLLEWASASLEASTNQGSLPHAVIALNCSKTQIQPHLWDAEHATKALLAENKHILESATSHDRSVMKIAEKWRRTGKKIETILDVVHCYYSSFVVVRLPDEKDLSLLSKQISQLYTTIWKLSEESYMAKRKARLLISGDDFGFYTQQAFNHFSRNLEQPFDFKEYALRRNPIPQSLGDHIVRMAIAIQEEFPEKPGTWIFEKLSFIVTSCFLYDCVSYQIGLPQDLFGDYLPNFENALTEFCSMYWPCEHSSKKGRCVNVSKRHDSKGHQDATGKVFAIGKYEAKFTAEAYQHTWMNHLKSRLEELQEELKRLEDRSGDLEDHLAPIRKQHLGNMERFYWDLRDASNIRSIASGFISHATCLCCLMRSPKHALRCGHVLCSKCVKAFGKQKKTTIEMEFCPLHPFETAWLPPWKIRTKPDFAGVRVLTLDGGGIRGIAELEVLSQIEASLGVDIPIAAFFDLIIGTSTGGIIALALGVKQWSVERCINEFKSLCNKAFTGREFHGKFGLQQLATLHHGSKWQTTPLYNVLEASLGDSFLFGGEQDSDTSYAAQVAVTSTNDIATKGVVIANYCRKVTQHNYVFLRPSGPCEEMKIWEAGAATSAAAPYFKPFIHTSTNTTYLDGAFHNNNPVKVGHMERQLIWPDVQRKPPDLLLSIGTSQDRKRVDKELQAEKLAKKKAPVTNTTNVNTAKPPRKWRNLAGIFFVGKAAVNRLGDVINCERQWSDFLEMAVPRNDRSQRSRYIRMNPDIGREPPALDAKEEVEDLQRRVSSSMRTYNSQLKLEEIAFRLVASSFYFDKGQHSTDRVEGIAKYRGKLQCRFEKGSEWLRQLGYFFKRQQRPEFQPLFDVWNGAQQQSRVEILLDEHTIERMTSHGDFDIPEIDIVVSTTEREADIRLHCFAISNCVEAYSVSGFPRDFFEEDDSNPLDTESNAVESSRSTHGLDRARTHRGISRPRNITANEDDTAPQSGTRATTYPLHSSSEQNLGTQPHRMTEEDRCSSADGVPKSKESTIPGNRTFSLKNALSHRSSRAKLDQQSGATEVERSPSIMISRATTTPNRHSLPPNFQARSSSALDSASTTPPSYSTATQPTRSGTPRSSLSSVQVPPPNAIDAEYNEQLDMAIRASLRQMQKDKEEGEIMQALQNSLLDQ